MAKIPERLTEGLSSLLGPAGDGIRWLGGAVVVCGVACKGVLIQPGQRDLITATVLSIGLLGPVWLALGGVQVIGASNSVVCTNGGMGYLALLITTIFEVLVAVFVLKGLIRTMFALSQTRDELVDPVLSLGAAMIPLLLGSVLQVGNESLILCLYP